MKRVFWRFFIAGVICGGFDCRAATFERMDFSQLTAGAEQIFIGTIGSAASLVTNTREIVTDFEFMDVEVIKGEIREPLPKVRMLGGTVGDLTLTIAGAPTFQIGKRYLVFIRGNGKVMFPTLGGAQGVFEVRSDAASGKTAMYDYAGRALTTLPITTKEAAPKQKDTSYLPEFSPEIVTKDAFVKEIQKRLDQ